MTTEYWEVWYPKAGATGLLLGRGLADTTREILLHSAPEIVTAEVRDGDGNRLAFGKDLERTLASPMCRLRKEAGSIIREDISPTDGDLGATVFIPGGEVGILKQWWHADDQLRWRWQVEFYNAIDSGVTTAPATGDDVAEVSNQSRNGQKKRPAFIGAKKSGQLWIKEGSYARQQTKTQAYSQS